MRSPVSSPALLAENVVTNRPSAPRLGSPRRQDFHWKGQGELVPQTERCVSSMLPSGVELLFLRNVLVLSHKPPSSGTDLGGGLRGRREMGTRRTRHCHLFLP